MTENNQPTEIAEEAVVRADFVQDQSSRQTTSHAVGTSYPREEEAQEAQRQPSHVRSFREEEERIHQSRAFLQNLYPDRLYFPEEEIPEGSDYRWIREEVQGNPDAARVTIMTRKGWTPVPASRHPKFLGDRTWGESSLRNDVIRVQGLILCERPKELGNIERKTLKARNEMDKLAVNWQMAGESGIKPRVVENTFSFGGAKTNS